MGIVVDVATSTIRYGDSLGGTGMVEIVDAVVWWLQFHMKMTFKHDVLPITQQVDSFSCGVLALNAVHHAILPDHPLLRAASSLAINHTRVDMFVRATNLDAQSGRQQPFLFKL